MGFKGIDNGFSADLLGFLFDQPEDPLVAQMHAVEISDGQDRIFERSFEIFFFTDHFHNCCISLPEAKINLSALQVGCVYPHPHPIPQTEGFFAAFSN
jgi:hypothetical protein